MSRMSSNPIMIYYSHYIQNSRPSHSLLNQAMNYYLQGWGLPDGSSPEDSSHTFIPEKNGIYTIIQNEHGKPALADYPDIHFSISHSGSFWACAVHHKQIGLDLQKTDVKGWEKLPARFFHPDECAWMAGRDQVDFCRLWAYKESYVKYNGNGLSQALDSFSVITKESSGTPGAQIRPETLKGSLSKSASQENVLILSGAPGVCQQELTFPEPGYAMVVTTEEPAEYRFCMLPDQS